MTTDKVKIGERTELSHEPVPGYPTAFWAVCVQNLSLNRRENATG